MIRHKVVLVPFLFDDLSAKTGLAVCLTGPTGERRRVVLALARAICSLQDLALAGLMLIGLLAGCGPDSKPAATGTVARPTDLILAPTDTPCPTPCRIGDARTRPSDGMRVLCVPAGPFEMGSTDADPNASDDEKPAHTVYLDAFWIDRTEVTNAQYRKCVEAGACWNGPECRDDSDYSGDAQPVVCVDSYQAQAYCKWAGARLPTEAEWEKAARGTDGRIYPWGDTFDGAVVNFCDRDCLLPWQDNSADDGQAYTAPVGSYPGGASPYGALDMAGNVWEWVSDWYDENYYGTSPQRNPQGPDPGRYRVMRGGSWYDYATDVRSANRLRSFPGTRASINGFRCASSYTSTP